MTGRMVLPLPEGSRGEGVHLPGELDYEPGLDTLNVPSSGDV